MSEITRDMIGCLCWFFDEGCEKDLKNIDILEEIDEDGNVYSKYTSCWWECCRPVELDEIKLHKNTEDKTVIKEKISHKDAEKLISIFKKICLSSWTNNKYHAYDKDHAELIWTEIQLFLVKALIEWNKSDD